MDLVSGGTSGTGSTDESGGGVTSFVSIIIESEGKLRTGSRGASLGGLSGARSSSSANVDIRLGGVCPPEDRMGELPVVMSESMENREIARGFPKLSRLNRSGRGGVGFTAAAGASVVGTEFDDDGTGLSVN